MTDNTFSHDYDVPEDLKFRTQDILHNNGLNCSAKVAAQYFDAIFTPPNQITRVQVELAFWPTGQEITVRGRVWGERSVRCDRCLKQTQQPFDESFLEMVSATTEIIDIMSFVRQTLALTEDIQFLCSPDCKGLCAQCGKNLNEGPCACQPEILSPFAVLKGKFN